MTKYAALIRAINVGGYSIIKMDALRDLFTSLGFKNVITYIQSGNVIFEAKGNNTAAVNKKIEKQLTAQLGFAVVTLLRTKNEIEEVIKNNPFDESKLSKDLQLYVIFLPKEPTKEAKDMLMLLSNEITTLRIINSEIYCLIKKDKMKNPFSNSLIEKRLNMKTTMRNWNTVKKIKSLLNS